MSPEGDFGGRCLYTADFRLDCRSGSRFLELLDGTLDALERLKGGEWLWAGGNERASAEGFSSKWVALSPFL